MQRVFLYFMTVVMCLGVLSSEKTEDKFCSVCQCQDSDVICNDIGQLSLLRKYDGKDVQCLIITGGVQEEVSENQFEEFSTISELYLQFGDLHNNPHIFGLLNDVIVLDLRHNSLTKIDSEMFVNNIRLMNLDLRDNKISFIESNAFVNLKELTMVTLSGNALETLENDVFAGLSALTSLDLSINKLRAVTGALLAPLKSLEELHLEDNVLRAVDSGLARQLTRPGLRTSLHDNPFVCTCESLGAAYTTYNSYTAVTGTVLDVFCDGDKNKPWTTVMSSIDCPTQISNDDNSDDTADGRAGLKPVTSSPLPDDNHSEVDSDKAIDKRNIQVAITDSDTMPNSEDGSRWVVAPVSASDDSLSKLLEEVDLIRDDSEVLEKKYNIQGLLLIFLVCSIALMSTLLASIMIILYLKQSSKITDKKRLLSNDLTEITLLKS